MLALVLGCAAGLVAAGPPASAATLTGAAWSASATTDGATGASYAYSFTAATSAALDEITMTVPTGTAGTPSVGTASPASIASGSVTLSGTTLTYSFTSATIISNEAISVQVNGLTNSITAGSSTSTITTEGSSGAVDTGTTGTVTFTATALTTPGWSASSTAIGATGVSYTYTFTTALLGVMTSATMTVPPGTAGTPTLGTVSPAFLGESVTLSGTTITFSGISLTSLLPGTAVSIQVNGLTNTATAGVYPAEIVTETVGTGLASGVTAGVSLTGPLTVTAPGSLTWAVTLNGINQSVADTVSGDEQLAVSDETLTGAGWDVTISATTFTNGAHTLPDTGTFVLTGAVSSITASTTPSLACTLSCLPPDDAVTYPVAVTTAASSPSPVSIYAASADSGLGGILLGGSTAADPFGWWVKVPGNAWRGAYTSTVTVAIASGP
ncbi:MAG: hypothetical protein ACRDOU_22605 [Streptosporangiaceae bacterium]